MVRQLAIPGAIKKTERRKISDRIGIKKGKKPGDPRCLWTTFQEETTEDDSIFW